MTQRSQGQTPAPDVTHFNHDDIMTQKSQGQTADEIEPGAG